MKFVSLIAAAIVALSFSLPATAGEMDIEAHKQIAKSALVSLKQGSELPLFDLDLIEKHLKAAGLTYKDIGTTPAQIRILRVKAHMRTATIALNHLESGSDMPLYDQDQLKKHLGLALNAAQ